MSNPRRMPMPMTRAPIARRAIPRDVGSPGFAALLSGLLPGLGQVYGERWIKGILMLLLPILAFTLAGAFVAWADPLTAFVLQNAPAITFLVIGVTFAYHIYVVADAFAGRLRSLRGRHLLDYAILALVTLALVGGYATIYRQSAPWAGLAARMFAPFASKATTPVVSGEAPVPSWSGNDRLNVLLLGIDTRENDTTTRNTDTILGVERIDILTGPQLMRGDLALEYARSRHDTNDYSRARRQQEVVGALRTRIGQAQVLRTLPSLIDTIGSTIETDFDPASVLPLARTGTGIDSSDIKSDVLYPCGGDYPHCELRYDGEGGFYLLPDRPRVRDLAASLFYDPKVRQEGARVEIQNTGARTGLARDVADRLSARAYGVTDVTNGSNAKSAVVLRNGSKRYTAEQLRAALALPIETTDGAGPDIVIRIGADFRGFATDVAAR